MRLCVFCGSKPGRDEVFREAAMEFGRLMVARGIHLVYGGARTGLMGIIADTVLAAGGEVDGVMPRLLIEKEINHPGLTRLAMVETMHERKLRMAELSDGFVALPGGIGTWEEIFEQWTWLMLGVHAKPCGFLNVGGYYDSLEAMARQAVASGFMDERHVASVRFETDAATLLDAMAVFQAPAPRSNWTA